MEGLIYGYILALCGLALVVVRRGFKGPRSWFAMCFLLGSSSHLFSYPTARLGYTSHAWLLDSPSMMLYLSIVAISMTTSWVACEVCLRQRELPKILRNVPVIVIGEKTGLTIIYGVTLTGVAASILLTVWGYQGYFIGDDLMTEPPAWLDLVRRLLTISSSVIFLIYLTEFQNRGRLSAAAWVVTALWSFTGVLTALKTLVILPLLLIILAGWLMSRLRYFHIGLFVLAIWCAYTVVEPMREAKNSGISDNALDAFEYVIFSSEKGWADPADVVKAFLNRVDYSKEAIRALDLDEFGLLSDYRSRLEETYRLAPLLALVPRALWPEKPLANLGQELSIALDNAPGNSLTPSGPGDSYLWAGFFGVILNSFLATYFTVLGGRLLFRYANMPITYVPVILLAMAFSVQSSVMAYFYMNVLRISIAVTLFYLVALRIGACRSQTPNARNSSKGLKAASPYAKGTETRPRI